MAKAPMNPLAGPSGPGKYSTRPDQLTLGSTSYGEGGETASLNTAVAKSETRGIADNVGGRPREGITPLFAQTERPSEPITNGIDVGAGAGSEALMMRQPDDSNFRAAITSYKPVLNYVADLPNTSPETRQAIRQLFDNL
jgi:hypothetical protein